MLESIDNTEPSGAVETSTPSFASLISHYEDLSIKSQVSLPSKFNRQPQEALEKSIKPKLESTQANAVDEQTQIQQPLPQRKSFSSHVLSSGAPPPPLPRVRQSRSKTNNTTAQISRSVSLSPSKSLSVESLNDQNPSDVCPIKYGKSAPPVCLLANTKPPISVFDADSAALDYNDYISLPSRRSQSPTRPDSSRSESYSVCLDDNMNRGESVSTAEDTGSVASEDFDSKLTSCATDYNLDQRRLSLLNQKERLTPDSTFASRSPPNFPGNHISPVPVVGDFRFNCVTADYILLASPLATNIYDAQAGKHLFTFSHCDFRASSIVMLKPLNQTEKEECFLLGGKDGSIWQVNIPDRRLRSIVTNLPHTVSISHILQQDDLFTSIDESGKVCIWQCQNGNVDMLTIKLQTKIDPKPSLAICVDPHIWVVHGRMIRVYDPNSTSPSGCLLTPKALSAPGTASSIASIATVPHTDSIFFGHHDGTVSIFSKKGLCFISQICISYDKIVSLALVLDLLWVGYSNGMIYVFDVSNEKWKLLKFWKAHSNGILILQNDLSSIYKIKRLQVVSVTTTKIKFWDGLLMSDWIEKKLFRSMDKFSKDVPVDIAICTWNCGASNPKDMRSLSNNLDLIEQAFPDGTKMPDIIIFCLQELIDLESKTLTAKNILQGKKKDSAQMEEFLSGQYRIWQDYLVNSVKDHFAGKEQYDHMISNHLVGLFTCVLVRHQMKPHINKVSCGNLKTGLGGFHGNKGALYTRFSVFDTSFCSVNCHLAAGQSQTLHRNQDLASILKATPFQPESDQETVRDLYVCGGDGSMPLDHEILLLSGDLNYRISSDRNLVLDRLRRKDLDRLLEYDQITIERRKNPTFPLHQFQEAKIAFAPTYKYDVGTDTYDTSEKVRVPAWCDRVFYRDLRAKAINTRYDRLEIRTSDHRPVISQITLQAKIIDHNQKSSIFAQIADSWRENAREAMKTIKLSLKL